MNKKAVSPLVGVILVIALSVTIGAMVVSWSTDFSKKTVEYVGEKNQMEQTCSMDVSIEFWEKTGGCKAVCYNDSNVSFTLTNTGKKEINGLKVLTMSNSGNPSTITINGTNRFPMEKADSERFSFELNHSGSELGMIKIYPVVKLGKDEPVCTDKGLVMEQVFQCPNLCYN